MNKGFRIKIAPATVLSCPSTAPAPCWVRFMGRIQEHKFSQQSWQCLTLSINYSLSTGRSTPKVLDMIKSATAPSLRDARTQAARHSTGQEASWVTTHYMYQHCLALITSKVKHFEFTVSIDQFSEQSIYVRTFCWHSLMNSIREVKVQKLTRYLYVLFKDLKYPGMFYKVSHQWLGT